MSFFEGGRVPLFMRLVDEDPSKQEAEPLRVLDTEELRESIRQQLAELFGTRGALGERYDDENASLSVLDYGIPELLSAGGRSSSLRTIFAPRLARLVEQFEPRLTLDSLALEPVDSAPEKVRIIISGYLHTHWVQEQVSFSFDLEKRGATSSNPI